MVIPAPLALDEVSPAPKFKVMFLSLTSKLVVLIVVVVPETVKSPEIVTLLAKVAEPASDISSVKAVIALLSSTPLKIISLLLTLDLITKSLEVLVSSPKVVPASFNKISAPSASKIISPPESNVISVPSLVIVSKAIEPTLVILLSLKEVAPSEMVPVAVKFEEPISIAPKPELIAPESSVPTVVI